jgi:hypothetical protein
VHRKALAAKRGLVRLNLNQKKCSSMHYFEPSARPVDVEAMTLADAIALAPSERIELIKMDIEGRRGGCAARRFTWNASESRSVDGGVP